MSTSPDQAKPASTPSAKQPKGFNPTEYQKKIVASVRKDYVAKLAEVEKKIQKSGKRLYRRQRDNLVEKIHLLDAYAAKNFNN